MRSFTFVRGIDARGLADGLRAATADAEDVRQPDPTCLFIGMLMPAIRAMLSVSTYVVS